MERNPTACRRFAKARSWSFHLPGTETPRLRNRGCRLTDRFFARSGLRFCPFDSCTRALYRLVAKARLPPIGGPSSYLEGREPVVHGCVRVGVTLTVGPWRDHAGPAIQARAASPALHRVLRARPELSPGHRLAGIAASIDSDVVTDTGPRLRPEISGCAHKSSFSRAASCLTALYGSSRAQAALVVGVHELLF